MKRRVIIFGLDGATYTVLDDLVRRGVMPNLRDLMHSGTRGALMSTIPPLTPPAWTTMVTGRSPGAHGIFNFLQFDGDSPYLRIISSREICCETIWSMVGRHGGRAASLNFVAHSPAPRINGYVIPGWVPWRWVKKHSHPADLIDRLKAEVPGFDLQELAMNFDEEQKAVAGNEIENYDAWIDIHIRREKQWFACLRHLLKKGDCDLLGIVFDGVDKLQHLLWQYVDPALTPQRLSPGYQRTREHCWNYFRLLDGFLGETIRIAGEDSLILVVSDHGFCGSTEIVYINNWLEQQGWLTWSDKADVQPSESQSLGEAHPYHLTHMDMARTKAYATSASSNGIHINVAGVRGAEGIHPHEYETFRNELRHALLTRCKDPLTGEPLITRVWTREEAFSGPKADLAPDLTVALRDGGFFSVLRADTILKRRPVVMGSHHPEGIVIAHGHGVHKGAKLPPVQMVDITPTILHALDLPIPDDLEGEVIENLFTEDFQAAHRAASEHAPSHGENGNTVPADLVDEEGEAQVLMRLKALGYIE